MTHILISREPNDILLRPFVNCPQDELPLAWAAMVRAAEVQHARAGSQCLAQIEEPAQPIAGYRISDPSDPTIKPWLSETPDDNGYKSEPLYAGAAPAAVAGPAEPLVWTPGPNEFKDWCAQWFGPDSDDNYLAEAVHALPPMAQRFARLAAAPALEAPAAPAGWKLVPEKPTDAMLGAAQKAWLADPLRRSSTVYAAALAAAPQAHAAPGTPPLTPDEARWAARSADNMRGPSDTTSGTEYVMAGAMALAAKLAAAPQAPAAPAEGEVLVEVIGLTGSGKSAICGEIEILCRALGLDVSWPDGDPEKNMTHAEWTAAIEAYKPRVRIVERNVPRQSNGGPAK